MYVYIISSSFTARSASIGLFTCSCLLSRDSIDTRGGQVYSIGVSSRGDIRVLAKCSCTR